MDDRPSLVDLHVDLLLLPFLPPVSHIPMGLLADMHEVSIARSEICRWCLGNLQVGCQRDEGEVKMRHFRMCRHPFVGIMRYIEKVFGRRHYMYDSHLGIHL